MVLLSHRSVSGSNFAGFVKVFEDRPQAQRGKNSSGYVSGVLVIVWIQPLSSNSGKWWCIGMDLLLKKYNPFLLVTVTPGGWYIQAIVQRSYIFQILLLLIPYWISSMCSRSHCHLFFWGSHLLAKNVPGSCRHQKGRRHLLIPFHPFVEEPSSPQLPLWLQGWLVFWCPHFVSNVQNKECLGRFVYT